MRKHNHVKARKIGSLGNEPKLPVGTQFGADGGDEGGRRADGPGGRAAAVKRYTLERVREACRRKGLQRGPVQSA